MPLVEHSNLPTFGHLRRQGHEVLSLDRAVHQDIRELHIGFLNMMPDAALRATERQFIRLVGGCNRIAQFFVYPFSLPELNRGAEAEAHIAEHYFRFEELRELGLDALTSFSIGLGGLGFAICLQLAKGSQIQRPVGSSLAAEDLNAVQVPAKLTVRAVSLDRLIVIAHRQGTAVGPSTLCAQ